MPSLDATAVSLSEIIYDYRKGEIPPRTPEEILKWVNQFDETAREAVLEETTHILSKTYYSAEKWEQWIGALAIAKELCGADPCAFWTKTHLLDLQPQGNSQREMNQKFREILPTVCEAAQLQEHENARNFVYLDDGLYTGTRIRNDLQKWITEAAPAGASLHVIVPTMHSGGEFYVRNCLEESNAQTKKGLNIKLWRTKTLENRASYSYCADVLRPVAMIEDKAVQDFVASNLGFQKFPIRWRDSASCGRNGTFSSNEKRVILENQFLIYGSRIRMAETNLPKFARPLGYQNLETLGFGATTVTFRNCPNNCPLVFWVQGHWTPLFPRRANVSNSENWGINLFLERFGIR